MGEFRVVKIMMDDQPFVLGEDEQVVDKRADYDDKAWFLLVEKGAKPKETPDTFGIADREAGLAVARTLANAISKASAAFAAALDKPVML